MEKADSSVNSRTLDSIERSFDKGTVGSISMRVTQANAIVKKKKITIQNKATDLLIQILSLG